MDEIIKNNLLKPLVEYVDAYNTNIYLLKDPTSTNNNYNTDLLPIHGTNLSPEARMDETVRSFTPTLNPVTGKMGPRNTYTPTIEQENNTMIPLSPEEEIAYDIVSGAIASPFGGPVFKSVKYVPTLIKSIPTLVSTAGKLALLAIKSPQFWKNFTINTVKDIAAYEAADAAVRANSVGHYGIGELVNMALGLDKDSWVGNTAGFTLVGAARRPIEQAGISAYKAARGAILPEYALSLAMELALWKPYVSRVIGENGKIRLRLPNHSNEMPREIVLEPLGNNKFYAHVRTWNDVEGKVPANLTQRDIGYLYEALYDELPEGAEILFPKSGPGNYATRGTVAGLLRLARDPRFSEGSSGTLLYIDKDGSIKEFTGTSFIKTPTTPSRVITYKEPTYPLYYKNTFNFPGLEQYNYGVLPIKDTAIRPLQHLLGKQALLMFKEYGGTKIPDELPIKNELILYAKEARVRYGLEDNTEITDLEIAEALYKHLVENDVVTYPGWGPLVGFRGTTSRANYLRSTVGPTEYATRTTSGSMDNSLGKLFLGRLPFSNPVNGSFWNKGVDRYLYVARPISSDNPNFFDLRLEGAGKVDITPQFFVNIPEQVPIELVNRDFFNKYFLYSLGNFRDASGAYKVRPEYTKKGINDLNAYMFRTPAYRDITKEMSVADWNAVTYPENNFLWLTKEKPIINPDGISGTYKGQEVIFMDNGLESDPGLRRLVGDLYLAIHENAIKNNLGLYISRPSVFRQEHKYYPYIALPQWNLLNAKHILPYDLRLPRLWGDPNVYLKAGGKLVKRTNN